MQVFAVLFVLTAFIPAKPCDAAASVRVLLDGKYLDFDVPPIIENDRTLAPLGKLVKPLVRKSSGIRPPRLPRLTRAIKLYLLQ